MVKLTDSAVSMVGVIAAQISLFICISIIGRLQGPEALGHFNYMLACGTFAGTLLALRYELACITDKPNQSFNALICVVLLSACVFTIGVVVTTVLSRTELLIAEGYALSYFVQQASGSYLNSLRRYGLIAMSRVAINGLFLLCLTEMKRIDSLATEDVFTVYSVINMVVAGVMLTGAFLHGKRHEYSFSVSCRFFRENIRFAAFILPSTICGSVLTYALAIVFPRWFDAESAGYFAAAYRLGFFPVSLMGQSLGAVFRRDAIAALAQSDAHKRLIHVSSTYAKALVLISIAYAVCGVGLFATLVQAFFGERWNGASHYFYDLVPLFSLQLIYVPLSQVFLATHKQRLDFLFQLACGVVLISVLYVARVMNFSAESSVRAFSLAGATMMSIGLTMTFRVIASSCSRTRALV